MILIISDDVASTHHIINWLIFYEKKYVRITKNEKIKIEKILISNTLITFTLIVSGVRVKFEDLSSIYIYKGDIFLEDIITFSEVEYKFEKSLNSHLIYDRKKIIEFINFSFNRKVRIGNLEVQNINKLIVLTKAIESDIKVPKSLITDNIEIVESFVKQEYSKVITKAIGEMPLLIYNSAYHLSYTSQLDINTINEFKTNVKLDYSLVQSQIEKVFEIRTFYFLDKFYSMAIFSQQDSQTKIDYRKYNLNNPNRNVPYRLPSCLEKKLSHLMKNLNLVVGSIDLIYANDDEYYLLEINPVGQFGMVSIPCNYYIEKKIAQNL